MTERLRPAHHQRAEPQRRLRKRRTFRFSCAPESEVCTISTYGVAVAAVERLLGLSGEIEAEVSASRGRIDDALERRDRAALGVALDRLEGVGGLVLALRSCIPREVR